MLNVQGMPKSFYAEFGKKLSSKLIIRWKKIVWKAKFDEDMKELYDLESFMRFFEIKLYNLVQFDYYGNDLFLVKIFRNSGIESNYQTLDPALFFKNESMHRWRHEEYMLDCISLEYQKSLALWLYNAYENNV